MLTRARPSTRLVTQCARLASTSTSTNTTLPAEDTSAFHRPWKPSNASVPIRNFDFNRGKERGQGWSGQKRSRYETERTAHVRTWRQLGSMAEGMAIVKVLERKYGKVREVVFSKDAERSEAYQFRLWVIFEDKSSIDLIRQANADSEPPHEDVGNTSRPKRIDGRTPASTEKGPHALDFKFRVPVVPPVQMKDGGVSLADLLPFVSGSAGAPAHAQTANERPLDNVDEMMEPQGPAPAGWKDIDIRLEPATYVPPTNFTVPATAQRDLQLRTLSPRTKAAFGRAWLDWGGFSTTSTDIAQPNLMRVNAKWDALIGAEATEVVEKNSNVEVQAEAEVPVDPLQVEVDDAPVPEQGPQPTEAIVEPQASNLRRAEWSVLDRLGSHRPTTVAPTAPSRSPQIEKQETPVSESTNLNSEPTRAQTKREKILERARAISKEPLPEHLIPVVNGKRPISQEEKDETAPQAFLKSFAETFRDGSGFSSDVEKNRPRSAKSKEGEDMDGRKDRVDFDHTEASQQGAEAQDEASRKETDETLRKRLMKFVGLGG